MHPNAELARELERCIKNSDESLANSGLRKGLVIRNSDSSFSLTKKGEDFVARWGQPFTPKPFVAKPVAVIEPQRPVVVTSQAFGERRRFDHPGQQQVRSFSPSRDNERSFSDTRRAPMGDRQYSRPDGFREPTAQAPNQQQSQPTSQYGRKPMYRGNNSAH
jgi:hypothetical protein